MIPFNNFSVLPFYASKAERNSQKWWMYGRVYPLFCGTDKTLPFQVPIVTPANTTRVLLSISLYNANNDMWYRDLYIMGGDTQNLLIKDFESTYGFTVYGSPGMSFGSIGNINVGRYYLKMLFRDTVGNTTTDVPYYSEIFTTVRDLSQYLRIEWYDNEDFYMPEGVIVYQYGTGNLTQYKNVLYLPSDIAKPEYIFEEEGENRDGFFFPTKQISEKRYRFSFFASEYLLDVMRFIRMADHVQITYQGHVFYPDTFLITPEWEANGDVASVDATFDCATVAKKIGFFGGGSTPGPTPPGPEPPDPPEPPTPTGEGDYLTSDYNSDFLV